MSLLLKNIKLESKGTDEDGNKKDAYSRWKLDKGELTYDIVDETGKLILYTPNPGVDKLLEMIKKEDNFPDSCNKKGGFWVKKKKDKPTLSPTHLNS